VAADREEALRVQKMLAAISRPRFDLECAGRLSSALGRLAAGDIDVVLLDLILPDSRGLETLALAHAVVPHVPIVILVAEPEEALALQAVENGAQDYLLKGQLSQPLLTRSLRYAIERHQMRLAVKNVSLIDNLTGLYNRSGFLALAERQRSIARRTGRGFILLFADLDGLKVINDTYGHAEGDRVLVAAADVLRSTFRDSDIIARLGGDEFAVLAIDAAGNNPAWPARRIREKLDRYREQNAVRPALSLSIGVVQADPSGSSPIEQLLAQADTVMYAEKRSKRMVEQNERRDPD
jgi:diguanylate cyclase (GGDEF)-like protein